MREAVMATQDTRSRKTGTAKAAAFATLGLAGLAGIEKIASALVSFFCIPLRMALETLPSILLIAWHIFQPCGFSHLRLLEGLFQVSLSWKFALILTGG